MHYRPILNRLEGWRRREPYVREIEEAGRLIIEACERGDAAIARRLGLRAEQAVGRAAIVADEAGLRDGVVLRELSHGILCAARTIG